METERMTVLSKMNESLTGAIKILNKSLQQPTSQQVYIL